MTMRLTRPTSAASIVALVALVALLAAVVAAVAAPAASAASRPSSSGVSRKVTICHATGSASNPYVRISVDSSSLSGHLGHGGDLRPAPAGGCPRAISTCSGAGLPCEQVPVFPAPLLGMGASLLGAGAVLALRTRRRRRG